MNTFSIHAVVEGDLPTVYDLRFRPAGAEFWLRSIAGGELAAAVAAANAAGYAVAS